MGLFSVVRFFGLGVLFCVMGIPSLWAADHPLQGTIWQLPDQRPLNRDQLVGLMRDRAFVLLGETHDNPAHHTLQAYLTTVFLRQHHGAVVAFEMIDHGQDNILNRALGDSPHDAAALGQSLQWEKLGWPSWQYYQPIAQAAMDGQGHIRSANMTRGEVRSVARGDVLPDLPAVKPLTDSQRLAMQDEIAADHCRMMPNGVLPGMVRVQQVRDALMARSLGTSTGVLIAGAGHVRTDRGVPVYLPPGSSLSIAFVEVEEGHDDIADYARDLPYDVVWFTERAQRDDPCQTLEKSLKSPPPEAPLVPAM